MTGRNAITVVGLVLVVLTAVVIGVAMYLVDKDAIGLNLDYCRVLNGTDRKGRDKRGIANLRHSAMTNGMELRGHWNGMGIAPLSSNSAAQLGLAGANDGAAVVHIDPAAGARAQQAGLRVGDVIVGVDGKQVDSLAELHSATRKLQPGSPTLVNVERNGQSMTFVIAAPGPQVMGAADNMGMQQVAAGPQFVCPRDGTLVPGAQAQATGFACPLCSGALQQMTPNTAGLR